MFELHSVERACRVQGGMKNIKIVDPNDLATQPSWNVAQDAGELDFLPGKEAYLFEQDVRTGRLQTSHDVSAPAGDFFSYRLEARMRAIRPTVESLRAKLLNRRVHVVVTYMDNLQRLLPYCRLSINDDSGARRADFQGYILNGVTRLLMPAPGVGGNIATVPPPVGEPETPVTTGAGAEIVTITTEDDTYTYTIPENKWLVGWEVRSDSAQTVHLGTTGGGNELGGPVSIGAGESWVGQGNMLPTYTSINIYFSGLQGENQIKLWLLAEI